MDVGDATADLVEAGEDLLHRAGEGAGAVANRLGLRRRTRILGLPIGPRRIDWGRVGLVGAGTAAVVAGTVGVVRARPRLQLIAQSIGARAADPSDDALPDGNGGEDLADLSDEELADLSDEERAVVDALREVESRTDQAIVSITTLERDDDYEEPGWVLTVGLRTDGSDNGVRPYRVAAGADGSVRDLEPLEDAGDE